MSPPESVPLACAQLYLHSIHLLPCFGERSQSDGHVSTTNPSKKKFSNHYHLLNLFKTSFFPSCELKPGGGPIIWYAEKSVGTHRKLQSLKKPFSTSVKKHENGYYYNFPYIIIPHLPILIPLQSFHDLRKTPGGGRVLFIHRDEIKK